jgi:hypothetical protein
MFFVVLLPDGTMCSDLFVKIQFSHVLPFLCVHLNRSPDLLNASIRRHSGLFCGRGECRRILPDELLHAQRPLPR